MANYKTRRQQKRFKLIQIVKRTALIIMLAAIAVLFFYMRGKDEKQFLPQKSERPQRTKMAALKNNPDTQVENSQNQEAAAQKQFINTAETFPVATATVEREQVKAEEPGENITVIKQVKKPVEKQLSRQKMLELLNRIKVVQESLGSFLNCVQVCKTNTSNVTNAFKIADFLKAKGFVISGRQIVYNHQEGIHVAANGSCITVTVGSL